MRYRQSNKPAESGGKHVNALIHSDDVLSTEEQEEVIRYFAGLMKTTNRFLLFIAGLHALVACVYLILLCSGSPLISTFSDGQQKQSFQDMLEHVKGIRAQQEQQEESIGGRSGSRGVDARRDGGTSEAELLRRLEKNRRAANEKAVMDFMAKRTAGGKLADDTAGTASSSSSASLLSAGSVCAMLMSAALLGLGAYGCWQAYKAMRLDTNELVHGEKKEARDADGRKRPYLKPIEGMEPAEPRARKWEDEARRMTEAAPPTALPRFHYIIAIFALIPTAYWVVSSILTKRQMNALYQEMGTSLAAGLGLPTTSLTGNTLEAVLMVWQPAFHCCIAYTLNTLYGSRAQLVTLSRLKYRYEKI